jgi:hypothetical protein
MGNFCVVPALYSVIECTNVTFNTPAFCLQGAFMCLISISEQTAFFSHCLIGYDWDGVFTARYELNLYMQFMSLKRLEQSVCLEWRHAVQFLDKEQKVSIFIPEDVGNVGVYLPKHTASRPTIYYLFILRWEHNISQSKRLFIWYDIIYIYIYIYIYLFI